MLPIRQKPKDTFMAPTYTIGGFDSSHTRQGGINLMMKLVTMVFVLLGEKFNKNRGSNIFKSVYPVRMYRVSEREWCRRESLAREEVIPLDMQYLTEVRQTFS